MSEVVQRLPAQGAGLNRHDLIVGETAERMLDRYSIDKKLGAGSYGAVFLVQSKFSDSLRVIKEMDLEGRADIEIELMKNEIELLMDMDHPYIVKLFEHAHEDSKLYLIMESLSGGDCSNLVEQYGNGLPEEFISKAMRQSLQALSYCHSKGVLHRDIKPENMMRTRKNINQTDIKIIDLGLGKVFGTPHELAPASDLCIGTPPYMAPELLDQHAFTETVDIWSLGITMYEMLTGVLPFGDLNDGTWEEFVTQVVQDDIDMSMVSKRSSPCRDLLNRMLIKKTRGEDCRPSASICLGHPFILTFAPTDTHGTEFPTEFESFANAPRFVKAMCLIIAAQADNGDKLHEYGQQYLACDLNGDGIVTVEELAEALSDPKVGWMYGKDVQKVAEFADIDGDGIVSFSEYVAACVHGELVSGDKSKDLARVAFDLIDKNNSGKISLQDIKDIVEAPHVKKYESTHHVDYLDAVRPLLDNSQKYLTLEEFRHILMQDNHDAKDILPIKGPKNTKTKKKTGFFCC